MGAFCGQAGCQLEAEVPQPRPRRCRAAHRERLHVGRPAARHRHLHHCMPENSGKCCVSQQRAIILVSLHSRWHMLWSLTLPFPCQLLLSRRSLPVTHLTKLFEGCKLGSSNLTGGRNAIFCCSGWQLTGNGRKASVAAVPRIVSQGMFLDGMSAQVVRFA